MKNRDKRYWANKYHFLAKMGGKCEECGYDKSPHALEFAHKDPFMKKLAPARALQMANRERIWEELQKCRLLCANCHKIETWTDPRIKEKLTRGQLPPGEERPAKRPSGVIYNGNCSICAKAWKSKNPVTRYCSELCRKRDEGRRRMRRLRAAE